MYDKCNDPAAHTAFCIGPGWGKDYADGYTFAEPLFGSAAICPELLQLRSWSGRRADSSGGRLRRSPRCRASTTRSRSASAPIGDERFQCWADFDKHADGRGRAVGAVPVRQQRRHHVDDVTNYSFDQFAGLAAFDQCAIAPDASGSVSGRAATGERGRSEERGRSRSGPSPRDGGRRGGRDGQVSDQAVLFLILVLFIVSLLTFLIFVKLPAGDPASRAVGEVDEPRAHRGGARSFGLDQPLYVQYGRFAKGLIPWPGLFLNEHVYYSYGNFVPVKEEIFGRAPGHDRPSRSGPRSCGWSWASPSASSRRSSAGRSGIAAGMLFALFGVSAPVFWLGYVFLYVFWFKLGWAPPSGIPPRASRCSRRSLRAGSSCRGSRCRSRPRRSTRGWSAANLIETMSEDYIRTARAKGLSERRVIYKHGLRAALTPVVTMFGLDLGRPARRAVITEKVFNLPGLGQYAVRRLSTNDFPAVMGVTVFARAVHRDRQPVRRRRVRVPRPEGEVHLVAEPLLEVKNLRVHFPTDDGVVKAVDGVSFSIEPGETLGVVGESGSGKSVSFLTVMGLINPKQAEIEGEVIFQGQDLLTLPSDELRDIRGEKISMIFQDPMTSLHPYYKVGDQIAEAIRAHQKVSKKELRDRRSRCSGGSASPRPRSAREQYPHEFSGGMRQRAMIAMALAAEPRPADRRRAHDGARRHRAGADPGPDRPAEGRVRRRGRDHHARPRRRGRALRQHPGDVRRQGRRVRATADDIYYRAHHPYTWGLLQSIPRLDESDTRSAWSRSGSAASLIFVPPGCPFHPRCPYVFDVCRTEVPALLPATAPRLGVSPLAGGEGAHLPRRGDGALVSVEVTERPEPEPATAETPLVRITGLKKLSRSPGGSVPEADRRRPRGRRRRPGHPHGRDLGLVGETGAASPRSLVW